MANKENRYAPEFRRQMVELARAGRTPAELSREFGPSAWTIAVILTRGAELAFDAGIWIQRPVGNQARGRSRPWRRRSVRIS